METLKFTLAGQNAFFKKPDVNVFTFKACFPLSCDIKLMLMSIVILLTDIYIRLHCLECWGQ